MFAESVSEADREGADPGPNMNRARDTKAAREHAVGLIADGAKFGLALVGVGVRKQASIAANIAFAFGVLLLVALGGLILVERLFGSHPDYDSFTVPADGVSSEFSHRQYRLPCDGETYDVDLQEGSYVAPNDTIFHLVEAAFGDLNGDEELDAAIAFECGPAGQKTLVSAVFLAEADGVGYVSAGAVDGASPKISDGLLETTTPDCCGEEPYLEVWRLQRSTGQMEKTKAS